MRVVTPPDSVETAWPRTGGAMTEESRDGRGGKGISSDEDEAVGCEAVDLLSETLSASEPEEDGPCAAISPGMLLLVLVAVVEMPSIKW